MVDSERANEHAIAQQLPYTPGCSVFVLGSPDQVINNERGNGGSGAVPVAEVVLVQDQWDHERRASVFSASTPACA